jgi:hypothetical protein
LVQGAFDGGWIWEPLAGQSTAVGHVVEAPDLPDREFNAYFRPAQWRNLSQQQQKLVHSWTNFTPPRGHGR